MKLCADILYWRLKEELKVVELHGAGSMELTLSRPEFYLDRTQTFEKNRVYICRRARRCAKMCALSASDSTGT